MLVDHDLHVLAFNDDACMESVDQSTSLMSDMPKHFGAILDNDPMSNHLRI